MQVAEGGSRVSRSGPTGIRGGADEGAGAAERKETRRLCWSPRVETRKRGAAAKCPPPRRPRPPGNPASRPMGVARAGRGLRTGAAPARPFRRLRRRACGSAEGRACALSAFLPTSGCRLHRFCSPVPRRDRQPIAR